MEAQFHFLPEGAVVLSVASIRTMGPKRSRIGYASYPPDIDKQLLVLVRSVIVFRHDNHNQPSRLIAVFRIATEIEAASIIAHQQAALKRRGELKTMRESKKIKGEVHLADSLESSTVSPEATGVADQGCPSGLNCRRTTLVASDGNSDVHSCQGNYDSVNGKDDYDSELSC
jgi:hypothetical protein